MSCGEDKVNEAWGINEPHIKTTNGEFRLSNLNTDTIYPHNAVLAFHNENVGTELKVQSRCKSISELEEFSLETSIKIKPKVSFIDLIPIELLISPENLDFDEMKCDFKFSAQNNGKVHIFDKNNIKFKSPTNEPITYPIQLRNLDLFLNSINVDSSSEFWCIGNDKNIFRTKNLEEFKNYAEEKTITGSIVCRQMKMGDYLSPGVKFRVFKKVHTIYRKTKNFLGYKFSSKQGGRRFDFTIAYTTVINNNQAITRYSIKKPTARTANIKFAKHSWPHIYLQQSENYIPYKIRFENNQDIEVIEDSDSFSFVLRPNQTLNIFLSINLKHPYCGPNKYGKVLGDYAFIFKLNETVNIHHSLEHRKNFYKKTILDTVKLFDVNEDFYLGLFYDLRDIKSQFLKTAPKGQIYKRANELKEDPKLMSSCRFL